MECNNKHFRHILLFYFRKGKKATEGHKEICEVCGVNCFKKDHGNDHINLVGLQRCCVSSATSKQPNDQLRCLLPTTCETRESNQRQKARIGKS